MSALQNNDRLLPLVDVLPDKAHMTVLCSFEHEHEHEHGNGHNHDASANTSPEVIARITVVRVNEDRIGHIYRQHPLCELVATVDPRRSRAEVAPQATREQQNPLLLGWLTVNLDQLDITGLLLAQRRLARAREGANLLPVLEQRGWSPGDLVPWSLLFPLQDDGLFWDDDRAYLAEVSYCITPGCPCQEVSVEVARTTCDLPDLVGICYVDLDSSAVRLDRGDDAAVEHVQRLLARPGAAETLRRRRERAAASGKALLSRVPAGHRAAPRRGAGPEAVLKASSRAASELADFMNDALGRHDWDTAWLLEFFGSGPAPRPSPHHPATQVFMGWLFYHRRLDDGQTLAGRYLEQASPQGLLEAYVRAAQGTPFSVYRVVSTSGKDVRVKDLLKPGATIVVRDPEGALALQPGEWILTMVVQLPGGAVFEGACPLPLAPRYHAYLRERLNELVIDGWTLLERLADSMPIIEAFGAVSGWMEQDEDDWDEEDDEEDDEDDEDDDEAWDDDEGDAVLVDRLCAEVSRVRLREISAQLRRAVLRRGDVMVEPLITLLEDEAYLDVDAPGAGYAPHHAAALLAELEASEAVPPLLGLLARTQPGDRLQDWLARALIRLGAAATLEPTLAALEGFGPADHQVQPMLAVLAQLGVADERIYQVLDAHLEQDPVLAAEFLADYGDPRALEPLGQLIDNYHVDILPPHPDVDRALEVLCEAFERLGGTLGEQRAQKLDLVVTLRDELIAEREAKRRALAPAELAEPVEPRRKVARPGRNQPCWCGSGKKYKKCHLRADEAQDRDG